MWFAFFGTDLCHPQTEGTIESGHTLNLHPIMGQGAAVRARQGLRVGAEARAQDEATVQIPIQGKQMGIGLPVHEVFQWDLVCEQ